jgi:hypothetical protein
MRQSVTISKVSVPNVIYKIHCFEFSASLTTLSQLIIKKNGLYIVKSRS